VSFATVLPGISATKRLLEFLGLFENARTRPLADLGRWRVPLTNLGLFCILLPMLWPRLFFPLVWVGFLLVCDPFAHARRERSVLGALEQGRPGEPLVMLLAGMVCGVLWEVWNFWAGAKWYYTIPYLGGWKVFEMPLAGYLGFPVFALSFYAMAEVVHSGAEWVGMRPPGQRRLLWALVVLEIGRAHV